MKAPRPSALPFLVILLAMTPAATAGNTLRVGPTQPFMTIQAAVDAAVDGDLIIVDPGSYPSFAISGKAISVIPSGAGYTIVQPVAVPAIDVQNVGAPGVVTIIGATINYAEPTAPAVRVANNGGAVRFSQLDVNLAANLMFASVRAAVEIDDTDTFWLIDSDVWSPSSRFGNTLNPEGPNDGVSAVRVELSDGVIQNVRLRGYDNENYAGDALRIVDNSSLWLLDDFVQSPTASIYRGGNGGFFGGNAIHLVGTMINPNRNTICGQRFSFQPGTGITQNGGIYAINNDGGLVSPGVSRLPRPCGSISLCETSVASPTVPLGGTINGRLFTLLGRSYATVLSDTTLYTRNISGFANRGMVDPSAALFLVVSSGTLPGGRVNFSVSIPNLQVLVGFQFTLQTAIGPTAGPLNALSMPSLVVVTP